MADLQKAIENGFPLQEAVQTDFPIVNAVCNQTPEIFANWQFLAGAAIFASIAILVFFYLFATFFRNDKTIAWIKIELFETISTAVIIIFVVILVNGALCSFNASFLFSDFQLEKLTESQSSVFETGFVFEKDSNIYEIALTYFSNIESQIIRWMSLTMGGIGLADMGTTQFKAHPMGQGFVTAPLAGFFVPIKSILNNGLVALTISYVINSASINILKYSLVAFPFYFFPAGLFFRAFEPTRRFGGTLIALAITFLVIYPVIISVSFYVTSIGMMGSSSGVLSLLATEFENMNPLSDSWAVFVASFGGGSTDNLIGLVFGGVTDFVSGVFSSFLLMFGSFFGYLYFIFGGWIIWWVALVGFLLPAINTIILVYSMRSLGKTLGEPIDITSLTRLI